MNSGGAPGTPVRPGRGRGPDGATCVRVHLVRHGQSAWNACGLLQGRTGHVPLSPRGLDESLRTAGLLAQRPIGEIWTSDQLRCVQTAEIIAAWHRLPVRRSAMLREQGHGVWEGMSVADHAPALAAAGPDWAPAGGETPRQLHARATLFARMLTGLLAIRRGDADRTEVVVVTHGETIRALTTTMRGAIADRMPCVSPENGSLTTVVLEAGAEAGTAGAPGAGPAAPARHRTRSVPAG